MMNRSTILAAILLLVPLFASAQADRQALAARDTRIMYDARGYGIAAAYDFVILNYKKHPVIIGVATDDKRFVEAVKQIIREMDRQGYENIALLLHDQRLEDKKNGETHDVTFFQKGEMVGGIIKLNGKWGLVIVGKEQKLTGIMLAKDESDYPMSLIRTKIRTTHDSSGAQNFVHRTGH